MALSLSHQRRADRSTPHDCAAGGREAWGPLLSSLFRERNTPTSRGLCQVKQKPSMQAISLPRTSHNTYNKYREPLFHFGCISTYTNGNARERADPLKSAPS